MSQYRVIDGIKCYHPEVAADFGSYPESGFGVTEEVEETSFWVRSRTRLLRREVLRAVSARPRARFLEIGCGTGTLLHSLASDSSLELLGSEIYLRGLRSAAAKESSIEFIQLDATAMPFESEFDVIGAFDVIEHINDDETVLLRIRHALKSGGHLILTVPQHPFLWSRLDEFVDHRRRYSRRELVRKIEAAGLAVEYVTSFMFTLFPLMLVSRLFDRRSGKLTAADFDRRVRFSPFVNRLFYKIVALDDAMISRRWSLPWGGTLFAIAIKRADS